MTRKDHVALGERLINVASMLALALAVSACHPQQTPASRNANAVEAKQSDDESYPAGVSGLNYSTYGIARFSITDAEGRTGGGPNISPSKGDGEATGGGKEKCCVVVPAKWREDMTVTVRWERDSRPDDKDRSGDQWLKAVAKVPPYERVTRGFWVRFLPGDRIVVQVNDQNLYIPAPMEDQHLYIAQGVLDDEANKAMQAARERDRQAAVEFRQQLRAQHAKARKEEEAQ